MKFDQYFLCVIILIVSASVFVNANEDRERQHESNLDISEDKSLLRAQVTIKCPVPGNDPKIVIAGTRTLEKVKPGELCTLVRVGTTIDGKKTITPVARSYDGHDWEQVAGKYATLISFSCDSTQCTAKIPTLNDNEVGDSFELVASNHSLRNNKDIVSRFLEQATFGPKMTEVNSLEDDTFAKWVEEQMKKNPTFHREYFRKHINKRHRQAMRIARPRHPCEKNSQWRKFTFTSEDRNKWVNVTGTGPYLLSIDGVPRTTVDDITFEWHEGVKFGPGDYNLCWDVEEWVGGRISFDAEDHEYCYRVLEGNPPVIIPNNVYTKKDSPLNTITFTSNNNFKVVNEGISGGDQIIHTKTLTASICNKVPHFNPSSVIGIFPNSDQVMFDPRLPLESNTLDNPITDGGGKNELFGADCANVPKTFLNADSCHVSYNPSSCGPLKLEAEIELTEESLNTLYSLTGRFLYSVIGLPMNDVLSPCTSGEYSRWILVTKKKDECQTPSVDEQSKKALEDRLNWSEDKPNLAHMWMWDGDECNENDENTIGMKLYIEEISKCYQQVHPEAYDVYDMTYWTREDTHPGNAVAAASNKPNPIKQFALDGKSFLTFPVWHSIDFFDSNKDKFDRVGTMWDTIPYEDLPDEVKLKSVAEYFGLIGSSSGEGTVVCGSPGEVGNDPPSDEIFHAATGDNTKNGLEYQKQELWTMVTLSAKDQLRQKVAWALSQILVITINQISDARTSESYLTYYDIFVRHAFGNYLDILREVSYSPMMAEMLSFLESKSTAFVWENSNMHVFPDENFAREVMQLFSIGTVQLNIDGTPKFDPDTGLVIPTYDNNDIMSLSRTWTGFHRQERRGNIELDEWQPNRIDPMKIQARWRDIFPKKNLYDGYIGDGVPLCVDMPEKSFLRKGAKYRLLGSWPLPELQNDPLWWIEDEKPLKLMSLNPSSQLHNALYNGGDYLPIVELGTNIECYGNECLLDAVRAVKVNNKLFYEYVRPPCVDLSFYDNGKKISKSWPRESMCAHPKEVVAYPACCGKIWAAKNYCEFSGERMSYEGALKRCEINDESTCDWEWANADEESCDLWNDYMWRWTDKSCSILAKVSSNGAVSIVHDPNLDINTDFNYPFSINMNFNIDTVSSFFVKWKDDSYPDALNNCGGDDNVCTLNDNECLCSTTVSEATGFDAIPISEDEILSKLHIGSPAPDVYDEQEYTKPTNANGVLTYHIRNGVPFDTKSIFGITVNGKMKYYKNIVSTVHIQGEAATFSFRNPPHFVNLVIPDERDAHYETEEVLQHYFYHDNTAPFLAIRFIQRFGISNPSPRFVKTVAEAFRSGKYKSDNLTFGEGDYGDIGAMVAAVLLDREARSVPLDADPTKGSLKEPLLKLIAFMRATDFEARPDSPSIRLEDLDQSIGQFQHAIPNVFSFFSPKYVPQGPISHALLVAPEAKVMNTPTIIGFMNGLISLINFGLTSCYGGLGPRTTWWCPEYEISDPDNLSTGHLAYKPNAHDVDVVLDDLDMLLTAGRLNEKSREIIRTEYIAAESNGGIDAALRIALQLMVSTPEFHSTNIVDMSGDVRDNPETPVPSKKSYKAIVFVMLEGGLDSFNMLVPHSECSPKDMYEEYSSVRGLLALRKSTLLTIQAKNQPCSVFGLHPNLPTLHKLYKDKHALFTANIGVLTETVTKDDWWKKTTGNTALFDHDNQAKEVKRIDVFGEAAGTGMLGRLIDELSNKGYKPGSISIEGLSEALSGNIPTIVLGTSGIEPFDPLNAPSSTLEKTVKQINAATTSKSGLFGETWSRLLHKALAENNLLYNVLKDTTVETPFPDSRLGEQLKVVSKLIKTAKDRGTDRDVFYVEIGGFDSHSDLSNSLTNRFIEVDDALKSFVDELKLQEKWENVVGVISSEFSRTLTPNTSEGSDHSWGGNYAVFGGDVNGGTILGEYPDDLTEAGTLNIDRGRIIPSRPWDSVWNPIVEWFGITQSEDLDKVLPNRKNFQNLLFTKSDMFLEPKSTCKDTKGKFRIRKGKKRNCKWVRKKRKCKKYGRKHCKKICKLC